MNEAQIRSVALFFFYTFLDKDLALRATVEALRLIEKRIKGRGISDSRNPILVYSTFKIWKKYSKKKNLKLQNSEFTAEGWIVPGDLKMETWRQFVKEAESSLSLAVIWSKLLGFADKDIAEGLGQTEGSVRYRVGKGLKHLGYIASPSGGLR